MKSTILTLIQPYLFFGGRCEEAISFYRQALGAEVEMLMRYKDSPEVPPPGMLSPGFEDKVMHASIRIGGADLMVSDGCDGASRFDGFRLSVSGAMNARQNHVHVSYRPATAMTRAFPASPRLGRLFDRTVSGSPPRIYSAGHEIVGAAAASLSGMPGHHPRVGARLDSLSDLRHDVSRQG